MWFFGFVFFFLHVPWIRAKAVRAASSPPSRTSLSPLQEEHGDDRYHLSLEYQQMDYSGRFHFVLAQTQSGNYEGEMGRGLSETPDSLGEMCKRVKKREAAAAAAGSFVLVFRV